MPLTIPWMRSMCAPASDSASTRTTGTTPATAASNRGARRARARAPQLLAVAREQLLVGASRRGGPRDRAPHVLARRVDAADQLDDQLRALEDLLEVAARCASARRRSRARGRSSARSRRALPEQRSNAEPTVPCPSSPIRSAHAGGGACAAPGIGAWPIPGGHAPRRHTSRANAGRRSVSRAPRRAPRRRAEDHRRARDAVVVVGHRVAVGARRRRHDDVARPRVVEQRVAHDHVARLAVLAREMHAGRAAEAVRDVGFVARAVEHRAQVVGHAAVDRDPRRDVALDADHAVERDAAVGDQRAARLDQQPPARTELSCAAPTSAPTNSSIAGGCCSSV